MRVEKFGSLEARVVGGTDREGGGQGPVVVMLHGFGAPGTDLVPLWRVLDVPKGTRFVFPAAPIDLSYAYGMGDARAWWMIDMVALELARQRGEFRDFGKEVPEGLDQARAQVIELLDAVEERLAPPEGQILLGGFSQGAMLSLDVALHDSRPLAGLALFSTTLIAEAIWGPKMKARKGLPVLQSHGQADPLLPFAIAEKLREHMSAADMDVEFVPFRGAHEIPPIVLERFGALAHRVLRSE
jgi:phospholipase/carboxylesterase